MDPDPAMPGTFHWSAGEVQPGRYDAFLEDPLYHALLSVPASGLSDARIEVPPPAEVSVRCVDKDAGTDVSCEFVGWIPGLPNGVSGVASKRAKWDAQAKRWCFH